MRSYCIGVFCIILGTALADSPSLIPTISLTVIGILILAGARLWAELDF